MSPGPHQFRLSMRVHNSAQGRVIAKASPLLASLYFAKRIALRYFIAATKRVDYERELQKAKMAKNYSVRPRYHYRDNDARVILEKRVETIEQISHATLQIDSPTHGV